MWNGIDRRKFPRAHYRCLIYIETKDAAKTISTYTENIGAGGICVVLKEDLGLFRGVNLELDLENGVSSNVKSSATVIWVIKKRDIKEKGLLQHDTGIEFVDISQEDKKRISKIVEERLTEDDL